MKAQPSALPGDVTACASGFSSGACGRKSIFNTCSGEIVSVEFNFNLEIEDELLF
jgi:hypothetical protein